MSFDLTKVGIEEQLQYECVYTTISKDGKKNAAPFAFIYNGDDKVSCHMFETSKSLANIKETNKYVVNVTVDPLAFSYSTIGNVPDDFFTDDEDIAILKDTGSYLIVEVESIKLRENANYPIKNDNKDYNLTGKIIDFKINDENIKVFNRGFGSLIESLVNYTRYELVDDDTKKFFDKRLEENTRIINKVSDKKTLEAIKLLKDAQSKK